MNETITVEYIIRSKQIPKEVKKYEISKNNLISMKDIKNTNISLIKNSKTTNQDKLTELFLFIITIMYFAMLIISVLIAIFLGSSSYTIWTNTITNLSSYLFTPTPYVFDLAAILAGISTIIFFILLIKKILFKGQEQSKSVCGLFSVSSIIGIIGSTGSILVGIFSSERSGPNGIFHNSSAIMTFVGLSSSLFFLSVCIIVFRIGISKKFGILGLFCPLIALGVYGVTLFPITEWILLFSILASLLPLKIWIISV
ncbi:MAG: hypothetical protein ACFFKA_08625 [Candidatus Thorarchaeota archaeon]